MGGASAQGLDYFAVTDHYVPIVFALVLGLSVLLLTLAFRSFVVAASGGGDPREMGDAAS